MIERNYRIIQIDAWADAEGGWFWNNSLTVGFISHDDLERIEKSTRKILEFFRNDGYLTANSKGHFSVESDDAYITIIRKSNQRPVFAIDLSDED